jgi:hypothetical protein
MKVQLKIPLDLYRTLETECDANNKRVVLMKNSVIADDNGHVTIRCEGELALDFISWANNCVPGAVSQIKTIPDE